MRELACFSNETIIKDVFARNYTNNNGSFRASKIPSGLCTWPQNLFLILLKVSLLLIYFQLSLDKQANIRTIFFFQKIFIFSISLACLPKGRNKYSVESNVRA